MTKTEIARIFANMPSIETDRLLLRRLSVRDSEDMYDYSRLEQVTRYLLWEPHPDKEYTVRYLRYLKDLYRRGEFMDWGLEWKENGRMIGTCGFTTIDCTHSRGEVGYVIHPDYQGRGVATEAVMAVAEYGFVTLGLNRLEAKFIVGNDASARVMEKCSMRFEGVLQGYMEIKGRFRDIGIASLLRKDFLSRYGGEGGVFGRVRHRRIDLFEFFDPFS